MENSVNSYPESEIGHVMGTNIPLQARWRNIADLRPSNAGGVVTFTFSQSDLDMLYEQVQFHNQVNFIRDNYCFIAIKNLIKKNEFLQLSLQLSEKLITEDEFENELENNPDKYLIQMNFLDQPGHIHILSGILNRIGRTFNTDEVSELFSIDIQSLNSHIRTIEKK